MRYLGVLEKAKHDYEKISSPSEANRSNYITRLIRLREKAARAKTDEWLRVATCTGEWISTPLRDDRILTQPRSVIRRSPTTKRRVTPEPVIGPRLAAYCPAIRHHAQARHLPPRPPR
jgi:hypothetical protein